MMENYEIFKKEYYQLKKRKTKLRIHLNIKSLTSKTSKGEKTLSQMFLNKKSLKERLENEQTNS